MGLVIKTNNFSLSDEKQNGTWEKDGLGWNPDYVAKSKGTNTTSKKYQENYDKIDWSIK